MDAAISEVFGGVVYFVLSKLNLFVANMNNVFVKIWRNEVS